MASNRIELVYPKDNYKSFVPNGAGIMDNEEYDLMMSFSEGKISYEEVKSIIKTYELSYLIVSSSNSANQLKKNGFEISISDKKNNLFMLKKI
jgi:hypothetical protein